MDYHVSIFINEGDDKLKNRKTKQKEYVKQYGAIPIDYYDRLNYMIDHYHVTPKQMEQIITKRNNMLNNLCFFRCKVVQLLEEPEGASRPRMRILNKNNFNREAMVNPLVSVYVPNAADDNRYMKQLVDNELQILDQLIATPCIVVYDAFLKTPSYFNTNDTFLSEIGLIRPNINKPDWDNIGKKYCDMYNHNIWLDDSMVITGQVNKYYSILPRIEITLFFLNAVYNKHQYNRVISRKDYELENTLAYLDRNGDVIYNE